METQKRVVLYHADCPDGFTAAWVAWLRWGDEKTTYLPVRYQEPPPQEAYEADDLYVLDFSYPLSVMRDLVETGPAKHVTWLDHHASAWSTSPTRTGSGRSASTSSSTSTGAARCSRGTTSPTSASAR